MNLRREISRISADITRYDELAAEARHLWKAGDAVRYISITHRAEYIAQQLRELRDQLSLIEVG